MLKCIPKLTSEVDISESVNIRWEDGPINKVASRGVLIQLLQLVQSDLNILVMLL